MSIVVEEKEFSRAPTWHTPTTMIHEEGEEKKKTHTFAHCMGCFLHVLTHPTRPMEE